MEPMGNIFHQALFKCPEMRRLLEARGVEVGTKDHAGLFLAVFESLMDNLEVPALLRPSYECKRRKAAMVQDTSAVSAELRATGRSHVRLWEAGFRAAHFDALIQSLLDATLKWGEKNVRYWASCKSDGEGEGRGGDRRTAECQIAWAEVCSFIVEELKQGFHQMRKLNKRKASLKSF